MVFLSLGKGGFQVILTHEKLSFTLAACAEKRAVSASRNVVSPLYYNALQLQPPSLFSLLLLLLASTPSSPAALPPPRRPSQLLTLRLRPQKRCFYRPLVPRSAAVVVLVRDAHTSCTCDIILRFFGIFVTIISRFPGIFCQLPAAYVLI